MIDVKELRIGNYIHSNENSSSFEKVFGLSEDIVQYCDYADKNKIDVYYDTPDKFSPIALTEEWLLKFGLCSLKGDYITFNQLRCFSVKNNSDGFFFSVNNTSIFTPLKHVHQLQNLYFALTGEELTLKQ